MVGVPGSGWIWVRERGVRALERLVEEGLALCLYMLEFLALALGQNGKSLSRSVIRPPCSAATSRDSRRNTAHSFTHTTPASRERDRGPWKPEVRVVGGARNAQKGPEHERSVVRT